MASVSMKKADKLHALNGMVRAKYKDQYEKLMERRAALAQRVYDETVGKEGWPVKAAISKHADAKHWVEHRARIEMVGVGFPVCRTEEVRNKNSVFSRMLYTELFSGHDLVLDDDGKLIVYGNRNREVSLKESVPWPRFGFGNDVHLNKAYAPTRKVGETLNRDIEAFNSEVAEFYNEAWGVLQDLRTTKQVDNMFPELWDYLPDGLRERLKQGLIPIDQKAIDLLRAKLPKKRRDKRG